MGLFSSRKTHRYQPCVSGVYLSQADLKLCSSKGSNRLLNSFLPFLKGPKNKFYEIKAMNVCFSKGVNLLIRAV